MNAKEYLNQLKARWQQLNSREKKSVAVGGTLLVLFIFYVGIWRPILNHLQSLRERVVNEQKTYAWMQSADKMLGKMDDKAVGKGKPVSLIIFLSQIQKQVQKSGLESFLTQLKQSEKDSVQLQFQKVEFDKLITLVMKVMKEYPVAVTRFTVVATDVPGFVNADMLMRQAQ